MGRTLPSIMQVFDAETSRWSRFRRALRREDQAFFDDMFMAARRHVASMACQSNPYPLEGILLAILLEERKRIEAMARELRELKEKMESVHDRMAP